MPQFNLNKAVQEIRKSKAKRVAIQAPEGLKPGLTGIIALIEKRTGAKAFAFVNPCYGACGIMDREAKELGAELLVHFGHTQFAANHCIDTTYVPVEYKPDKSTELLAGKLSSALAKKGFKKIGLCSTIQFRQHLEILETALKKKGFTVFVGRGKGLERGQVLGCNYSSVKGPVKKAQAVAFVGDGVFHALGLGFAVKKPVYALNPTEQSVEELGLQKDLFLRKRIAMIEKAKQAKSIAIWVSTKRGQQRMQLALKLREKFQKAGKKAFVFASDLLIPDYIAGIRVEAIVSTACPRIALDDSSLFRQPILNPSEATIALGERKLEEYTFEELA